MLRSTKTATGLRLPTHNMGCSFCGKLAVRLRMCSACGGASYCGRDCQKAAWRGHKPLCRSLVASFHRETEDGKREIHFDQHFGGLFSVIQTRMFRNKGKGILLISLSHSAADFRKEVEVSDGPRLISFEWVLEKDAEDLDVTMCEAGGLPNLNLVSSMLRSRALTPAGSPGIEPGKLFIMVMRALDKSGKIAYALVLMMNYLYAGHPAHDYFAEELKMSDDDLLASRLDWDTKEVILVPGYSVSRLPKSRPLVEDELYASCLHNHELAKAIPEDDDGSPPELHPPLAKTVSISVL